MVINKKLLGIFLFLGIIIFSVVSFVSAQNEVCCMELKTGQLCQDDLLENCNQDAGYSPGVCDRVPTCMMGTCVYEDSGECDPGTPQAICIAEGGEWDVRAKDEVPQCQLGCCFLGENAFPTSKVGCTQAGTDYSQKTFFREDIRDPNVCTSLSNPNEYGACVFEETGDCSMGTKERCLSQKGYFNVNLLCTATELETNCAKTSNTQCFEEKVYFEDSCGNRANVYDANMFTAGDNWNAEMQSYWRIIQEPKCTAKDNYANCGDCSYIEGSTCREFNRNDPSTTMPKYGENVCADLSCQYDTNDDGVINLNEHYEHGESWCAESEGILNHIKVDALTGAFQDDATRDKLFDPTKYNLPGSRYYKLICMDGEVISEPCRDYRNEICVESTFGETNFEIAQCSVNNWRECVFQNTSTQCESTELDCKWIPGYRMDLTRVTTPDDRNHEEQGSCVPLYSPGFKFWEKELETEEYRDGIDTCALANVVDAAIYETSWLVKRDNFADQPTCLPKGDGLDAVGNCFANCYTIPDYGKNEWSDVNYMSIDRIKQAFDGESMGANFESFCISDRKGYYCEGKTGGVVGRDADCADGDKKANYPIFFTHEEWLDSIWNRGKSMGDCGYKPNVLGNYSSPNSEIITASFEKLKQDMNTVRGNGSASEKVYVGNERVTDEFR